MTRSKDAAIEVLRGLALVLMVAGHVIGSDATLGIQVGDGSLWRMSYVALEDLRMPLFTALSGYVYALRPVVGRPDYPTLVRGKVRRLLVPLLTVGALTFAMQLVVPGVHRRPDPADAWRILVFPFQHLWFLQSIFLIFVLVGLLDAVGALDRLRHWGPVFAVACVLHVVLVLPEDDDVFSINGLARLLPFFLLGMALHRFRNVLDQRRWLRWSLPVFALMYGVRLTAILTGAELPTLAARALSLGVGVAGLVSLLLLRHAVKSATLAWLGPFAFGVYLLHVLGAAGARTMLERLGFEADPLIFAVGLAAGIGLPVLFQLMFGRFAVVSRLILGQKPESRPDQTRAVPDVRREDGRADPVVGEAAQPVPPPGSCRGNTPAAAAAGEPSSGTSAAKA